MIQGDQYYLEISGEISIALIRFMFQNLFWNGMLSIFLKLHIVKCAKFPKESYRQGYRFNVS